MKILEKGEKVSTNPPNDLSWIGKKIHCEDCGARFILEKGDYTETSYELLGGYDEGYAPTRVITVVYCPTCGKRHEIKGKKYRLEHGEWKRVRFL